MSDVILRKFWLENETGDAIPLNGEQGIWLVDPTGLGMASNSSFTDFGHGFFRSVDKNKDPQQTVAGDLYFIDHRNPYVEYKRFADWVVQAETLYLVYQPASIQYRRKVLLSSITKEELLTQELLKCPVAFYGLTPWFTKTEYVIPAKEETIELPFRVASDDDYDAELTYISVAQNESSPSSSTGSGEDTGGNEEPGEGNEEPLLPDDEEPLIIDGGGVIPSSNVVTAILDYPSRVGDTVETIWSNSGSYSIGDKVRYPDSNGHFYTSLVDNNTAVPTDSESWKERTYHRLRLDNRYRSSINIYPTGQKPAGFVLQYAGVLVNPTITVRSISAGSFLGQCSLVNVTTNGSDRLVYMSDYESSGIIKMGQYDTADLINNVENLSVELYPKLPVNQTCMIELSADNEIVESIDVTLIEYYKGV